MKRVQSVTIYPLNIPFTEVFAHNSATRASSDSVIVKVTDDDGVVGFGEGVARPYVTGETTNTAVGHLVSTLAPAIVGRPLPDVSNVVDLVGVHRAISEESLASVRSDNASRGALELALIDCALRGRNGSAADVLGVRNTIVVYSGVVGAASVDATIAQARQMKLIGLRDIKVKVGFDDDVRRVGAVRDVFGDDTTLRLDANGAWTVAEAHLALAALEPFGIAAVEEPLRSRSTAELKRLRQCSAVPIVVDESLVTAADADSLIESGAADVFNIRVSKCGGLGPSLLLAQRAHDAGIGVQIGAHVGETAVLSAAGRLLAAACADVTSAEGSFGRLLLAEDVAEEPVQFGRGGTARVLGGAGLGIAVDQRRLDTYATAIHEVASTRSTR